MSDHSVPFSISHRDLASLHSASTMAQRPSPSQAGSNFSVIRRPPISQRSSVYGYRLSPDDRTPFSRVNHSVSGVCPFGSSPPNTRRCRYRSPPPLRRLAAGVAFPDARRESAVEPLHGHSDRPRRTMTRAYRGTAPGRPLPGVTCDARWRHADDASVPRRGRLTLTRPSFVTALPFSLSPELVQSEKVRRGRGMSFCAR